MAASRTNHSVSHRFSFVCLLAPTEQQTEKDPTVCKQFDDERLCFPFVACWQTKVTKMPFLVGKVNRSLTQVEWKTSVSQLSEEGTDPIEESFQLDCFNPFSSYSVSCLLYVVRVPEIRAYKAILELHWQRLSSTPTESHYLNCSPDIHHQPCAILICVDGREEIIKMRSGRNFDKGVWETDEFIVNTSFDNKDIQLLPVTLHIWIQFEPALSRGELCTLNHMADLFLHQKHCDVQFYFDDGQSFGGHMCILSARSPAFSVVLEQVMGPQKKGKVYVRKTQSDMFKQLLYYIYTGQTFTPLNEVMAQSLYVLAVFYGVEDLKEECVDFLLACIRKGNVHSLYAWARRHSIEKIKEAVRVFMEEHGIRIIILKKSNNQTERPSATEDVEKIVGVSAESNAQTSTTVSTQSQILSNPSHPPYLDMIVEAIRELKNDKGSSRLAILKYIKSTYELGVDIKDAKAFLKQALIFGVDSGVLANTNTKGVRIFHLNSIYSLMLYITEVFLCNFETILFIFAEGQ